MRKLKAVHPLMYQQSDPSVEVGAGGDGGEASGGDEDASRLEVNGVLI